MTINHRRWAWVVLALTFFVGVGCGANTSEPRSAAEAQGVVIAQQEVQTPAPPEPKDAAQAARKVVEARIGAMLRVDRLRGHPAGERLVRLGQIDAIFEGTDVDLLRDATLAFVASTGVTRDDTAVLVVQHRIEPEALRKAVEAVMARSEPQGQWLTSTKVQTARIRVRGHEQLLALCENDILVVLPPHLENQVNTFAGPLKLSSWDGPEAMIADVDEPSTSLRAKNAPKIPPTINNVELTLTLRPDGGLEVQGDGQSTDAEQAKLDAKALTRAVAKATSVKVSIVRVRFFKKVPFRAEGDQVKSKIRMSAEEVSRLLSMAEALTGGR
ncbi:MAG: hypothetical protein CSA75_01270 [Sorangium cellulosum]|nr:MAG: hypothetical protein CSA75_01270 [Sorangium cellulosum]